MFVAKSYLGEWMKDAKPDCLSAKIQIVPTPASSYWKVSVADFSLQLEGSIRSGCSEAYCGVRQRLMAVESAPHSALLQQHRDVRKGGHRNFVEVEVILKLEQQLITT